MRAAMTTRILKMRRVLCMHSSCHSSVNNLYDNSVDGGYGSANGRKNAELLVLAQVGMVGISKTRGARCRLWACDFTRELDQHSAQVSAVTKDRRCSRFTREQ